MDVKGISALRAGLVLAVVLLLSGCIGPLGKLPANRGPLEGPNLIDGHGILEITLDRGAAPQQGGLMALGEPTSVRVRVYGPGVDIVKDQEIEPGKETVVALQVPVGTGYTVDVVTYHSMPGSVHAVSEAGRLEGVDIAEWAVRTERIPVAGYFASGKGPISQVTAGSTYTIEARIEGPNIWGGRVYFKISDTPWTHDGAWGPEIEPGFARIVDSGPDHIEVVYEGTAPEVDGSEPKSFYFGFELWANSDYHGNGGPLIGFYVPSVDAGDELWSITVRPR